MTKLNTLTLLPSQMVRKDIHCMVHIERHKRYIIRCIEHEYKRDHPLRGRIRLVGLVLLDADRPRQKQGERPRAGREEQEAPPELVGSDEARSAQKWF
ncbi:hypothetical protein FIBSPDRAFT_858935 [Athelia psychrophila]|uniref:Uncharacterized protein n=1 Tax=Athelia psychrophila TaxID=1759441 RepID=A0A166LIQ7_9AGAM|nr:hypothetical protein FIBSPDRAFT_858935 [Fibularhizoctonia sp. CBS 109695]